MSLRLSVLDAQLVDQDRLPIGRVDDVDLEVEPHSAHVRTLLTGVQALGERIGGDAGSILAAGAARLRESGSEPVGIATELVDEVGPLVRLNLRFEELPEVAALERWLAERVVTKLPGAGNASR
jgi:hypothetical protein